MVESLALSCRYSIRAGQSIGDKEVLLVRTIKEDTKDKRTLYQTSRGLANTGRTSIVRSNSHAGPWKLMGSKLVGVKGVQPMNTYTDTPLVQRVLNIFNNTNAPMGRVTIEFLHAYLGLSCASFS